MKNRFLLVLLAIVFATKIVCAQQVKIKVVDETSRAIEGATVIAGQFVLITDSFGIITVPDTLKLPIEINITYVGYESKRITLSKETGKNITFSLTPSTTVLKDVIVNTGYAQFRKHTNVGSFEVVQGEDILKENTPFNIIEALEDRLSSVTVDRRTNSGSLMVRGLSTIRGDRMPLIVLDNFPYEGDLESINPNDVENITVLKDASASSIWGARASNGVIVITTKKGAKGAKLNIDISSNQQVVKKPNLFYEKHMSNEEMISVERFLFDNNFYNSRENQSSKPSLSPVVELLIKNRDDKLSNDELVSELRLLENNDLRREFYNNVYRIGVNNQNSFRLAKNDKAVRWNFSTGYDNNIDYLHRKTKRVTATLGLQSSLSQKIKVDVNMAYSYLHYTGGKDDLEELNDASGIATNYYRIKGDDNQSLSVIKDYRQFFKDTIDRSYIMDWNYYPLEEHKWRELHQKINSLIMRVGISYELLPKLELRGLYQYELQNGKQDNMYHSQSYYVRNQMNNTVVVNDGSVFNLIPEGSIRRMSGNELKTSNFRGALHYEKYWNNHTLSIQSGMDLSSRVTENQSNVLYGFDPHNYTSAPIDYLNSYPSILFGTLRSVSNNNSLGKLIRNTVSQYSYLRYGYDNRFELFTTFRKDASNLFGVSTNNKWNPFWSIGAGWTLSEELFYKWQDILPWVRLRITNGINGNVSERMAAVTTISYGSVSNLTGSPYANFSNYYNPDLTWEETQTLNFGLDFRLLGNLIEGSFEYYHKTSSQLYGNTPIDYTAGVGYTVTKNVADMEAKGFDVNLKMHLPLGKNFLWNVGVFTNYYKDKVKSYYQSSDRASSYVSGLSITAIEGYPVHALYSYNYKGLNEDGDPLGVFEGEESIDYRRLVGTTATIKDLIYAGPIFPKWSGALDQTFRYKKTTLNMRISYRFGSVFRRNTINYGNLYSNRLGHSDFTDRWQNEGDESFTSIPKMIFPVNSNRDAFFVNSTYTVSKGDYIRLNNIGVSYQETVLKDKIMEVGLHMSNVGLLYKATKEDIDPEYPNIPLSVIYQFRLSFKF